MDILTLTVFVLKLNGGICILFVDQFLITSSLLEYSSIAYSSQVLFQEIDTEFDITVT